MISRISIILLVIALLALAGLQYHWIGEISVAERQRLEVSVRESSNRFAADFSSEIRSLGAAFDLRGSEPDAAGITARYRVWEDAAASPELLKTLYLVRSMPAEEPQISQVDLHSETLLPIAWPARLMPQTYFNAGPPRQFPFLDGAAAVLIQLGGGRPPEPSRGRDGPDFGPGPGPGFGLGPGRGFPGRDGERRGPGPGPGPGAGPPPQPRPEYWLVAELDESVFSKQIFPALAARDFAMSGDQEYRLAVVPAPTPDKAIFSTGKSWTAEDFASPDYSIELFGFGGQPQNGGFMSRGGPPRSGMRGGPQSFYIGQPLRLLVKHEAGSLELAVANLRRRNLGVSFGVLLVLGLGAGVVIVSGQRARALGKLQMEFAAGVSHELRTPLAVIQSAAHNLRAGVVRDREGIEEYATIVQKEARRLSGMVEQVMTYAETQSGRKRYDIAPCDLNRVVDGVLQNMAMPLTDANATVENRIDPQLPLAMADAVALSQCVQNLLSNALKYGSSENSVQIEIESEVDRATSRVLLRVIDHGPGVPPVDERHLFDPFHRGSNAATHTPGNGLGLHLVQRIMESQKGNVSYTRAANAGACFTLSLPLAEGLA